MSADSLVCGFMVSILRTIAPWLAEAIDVCESPIEKVFLTGAIATIIGWQRAAPDDVQLKVGDGCMPPAQELNIDGARCVFSMRDAFVFYQQVPIHIDGTDYRSDFAMVVTRGDGSVSRLAIELDGHDWHERTPEQARRDKSRDRAFLLNGWIVARYTGVEILENASECFAQCIKLVSMGNV